MVKNLLHLLFYKNILSIETLTIKYLEIMNTKENRETFIARLTRKFNKEDIDEIMLAYDLSKEGHRTHKRDTGERYFEHPRAGVLIILDELNWYDKDAIIAFLLHDTGEDTPLFGSNKTTFEEFVRTATFRITKIFNRKVAEFVIGLTKPFIDNIQFINKKEVTEYYLNGLSGDLEISLLKKVDRLHNLRTSPTDLDSISKTRRTVKETIEVYLPLFKSIEAKDEKAKMKNSLIKKIEDECKRLEKEITPEREKSLRKKSNKKWDEISELCKP